MYTKEVITARLTAWYGDSQTYAHHSPLNKTIPLTWTPQLLMIKELAKPLAGARICRYDDQQQNFAVSF